MMNRSVMGRQMFQEGGMAMPDPMAEAMPMDPAMGANPEPPSNLDENMVNEAMMAASQDFGSLDDVDDYEGMINAIRGDQAPMAERVNELADMVGLEDAQQTPDSVVALLQPVMLLNSMDQGIGSIAEGVMDTEMSGDMTGGIMSTVNMEPPMDPAMAQPMPMDPGMDPGMGMPMEMGVGNEPPVNFRQGGAVQYFAPENEERVVQPGSLTANFAERQELYNSLIPPQSYDESDAQRQREMTQAQMLFDVAGTALAFATPGSTQMSPAQRLAEAATETQLFDKIGARAQNQMDSEKARKNSMRDEKMKMDLLALGSAETMTTAQAKARADSAGKEPKVQQFLNEETDEISKYIVGTPGYKRAMDDDSLALMGNATPTKDDDGSKTRSTTLLNFFKPRDPKVPNSVDERIDIYADQFDEIEELRDTGFQQITTPSMPKGPELSDELQIISNQDTLDRYAENTLPANEVNILELAINSLTQETEETAIDGTRTKVPATALSKNLQKIIRDRKEAGLSTPETYIPPVQTTASLALRDLRNAPDLTQQINVLNNYTDAENGFLDPSLLRTREFKRTLLNYGGTADITSDSWKMIPTTIFDPKINYDNAIGLSTILPKLTANYESLGQDLGMRDGLSPEVAETNRAVSSLKTLKLQTLGKLAEAVTAKRVLKSVQDEINENIKGLEPRIFGFDANTLTTMTGVVSALEKQFNSDISMLDEYGGNSSMFDRATVNKARVSVRQFEPLIAEYVKFIDRFKGIVMGPEATGSSLTVEEKRRLMYAPPVSENN